MVNPLDLTKGGTQGVEKQPLKWNHRLLRGGLGYDRLFWQVNRNAMQSTIGRIVKFADIRSGQVTLVKIAAQL